MPRTSLYWRLVDLLGPAIRAYSQVKIVGRENLPPPGQGTILASNHPGSLWWDAFCLAAALPDREIRFVAQHWDSQVRLLAGVLNRVGALFTAPSMADIHEGSPLVQALRRGAIVSMFPEGTYHSFWHRYTLFPFGPQTIAYAAQSGAVIVPTAIIGAEEATPTFFGWKQAEMPFHLPMLPLVLPWPITIEFGVPVTATELAASSSGAQSAVTYSVAAGRLRQRVAGLVGHYRDCRLSEVNYVGEARWW